MWIAVFECWLSSYDLFLELVKHDVVAHWWTASSEHLIGYHFGAKRICIFTNMQNLPYIAAFRGTLMNKGNCQLQAASLKGLA